jgi:tRNA-dihydrouridine synthase B
LRHFFYMDWNSFLAPIDGYTDLPFRLLCQRYGATAACVPLVNSAALARNPAGISAVDAHRSEKNCGIQLAGSRPEEAAKATEAAIEAFPFLSWLNLNCGCPSPRTVETGGGSALLRRPKLMLEILAAMKKRSPVPVSVKLRVKDDMPKTAALCRQIERAGADFIILHGRTPAQGYSGKADWELIRSVHERVGIPLVGNGDIAAASEGRRLVAAGYCDSFMAGRAAMANPMLFSDRKPDGAEGRLRLLEEYLSLCRAHAGEAPLKDVKLKALNFMSGVPGAAALRNSISRAGAVESIFALEK